MMTARSKPNYRLVISINIFVPLKFYTLYLTEISYVLDFKQLTQPLGLVTTTPWQPLDKFGTQDYDS